MIAALGPLVFEIQPVNLHGITRTANADFAEKPVLGRRPPLEFVGEGAETMSLAVKLFPEKFGGISSLDLLDQMRKSGQPHYFMRGDGRPAGFFVITSVVEKSTYLGPQGIGRVIDVDISLKRAGPPAASGLFAMLEGFF